MNFIFSSAKKGWDFYVKITKPIGLAINFAVFSLVYAFGVGLASLFLKISKNQKKETTWENCDQTTDSKENWMRSF